MDDLMTGIGVPNGMNDINNMNELAPQAEAAAQTAQDQAMQAHNTAVQMQNDAMRAQQPTGYGSSQNSYGQQPTGYGSSQNSYGQQSTGYGGSQSNYSDPYRSNSGYDSTAASYAYNDLGGSESMFVPILKAILGAAVGAIPGVILIIFVAKMGFIASICGAVMAIGVFAGYTFMTKDNEIDTKIGVVICAAIMLIGIYIAVRTSWVMNISDAMREAMSIGKSMLSDTELSDSDINDLYRLIYGVDEPSFSECSSHFGDLLSRFGLKGKFILSFFENLGFAALGCFGTFAKFGSGSRY